LVQPETVAKAIGRDSRVIFQHDGAKPHTGLNNNAQLEAAGSIDGWTVKFVTQPPNSPDLNILDLGLFASLKSKVWAMKFRATNIELLVQKITAAFEDYPSETLTHIWAQLYAIYNAVLKQSGGNKYTNPHTGINRRARNGGNAIDLSIDVDEYNRVFNMFNG
jgi:hypothetical protein